MNLIQAVNETTNRPKSIAFSYTNYVYEMAKTVLINSTVFSGNRWY